MLKIQEKVVFAVRKEWNGLNYLLISLFYLVAISRAGILGGRKRLAGKVSRVEGGAILRWGE